MDKVVAVALILYGGAALLNHGFIAVDDYASNIEMVIPAQSRSFRSVIDGSDFRPQYSNLLFLSVTKLGFHVGLSHPVHQLMLLRTLIAIVSVVCFWRASIIVFAGFEAVVAFSLISFYFLSPLLFTRVLIEATSAPWLLLSAALATRYWREKRPSDILLALGILMVSTLFRYQNGLCIIPVLALPIIRHRFRDFCLSSAAALGAFVLVGLADLLLKGQFHSSLFSYLAYNIAYSSDYGRVPIYGYVGLLALVGLPLFLIGNVRESWRKVAGLLPLVSYGVFFIAAHSLVPHKEERFVIPVLPLFLMLFTPMTAKRVSRGNRYSLVSVVLIVNFILLVMTTIAAPQSNVVSLAKFIDRHPTIDRLIGFRDTLWVFPRAYIGRPITEMSASEMSESNDCGSLLAVRANLWSEARPRGWALVARFPPGVLERLLVRLNPHRNQRRGAIELWRPESCATLT